MAKNQVLVVEPGMSIGAAIRGAGMVEQVFDAVRVARIQSQGASVGCPACAVSDRRLLQSVEGSNVCRKCRREARN